MQHAVAICHESDELWKVERSNGLGGSDAPQILGISPFGGPAKVAASKLGFHVEDVESELLEWGHYVEEPLIRRFYDETGIEGKRSGILYRSTHPARPWLQCTVDGDVPGDPTTGIQCKNAVFSADLWDEGVPDYIEAQVQHEMAVTGWERVFVLVLLRGYQFRWKEVRRDERAISDLLAAEAEFWRRLHAGEPIEPKGAPDQEWAALKARFPTPVVGKEVRLEGETWRQAVALWRHHADHKLRHEKLAKECRNTIVAALGDATAGILDDGSRVTLSVSERKEHVVKASTSRTLYFKEPK